MKLQYFKEITFIYSKLGQLNQQLIDFKAVIDKTMNTTNNATLCNMLQDVIKTLNRDGELSLGKPESMGLKNYCYKRSEENDTIFRRLEIKLAVVSSNLTDAYTSLAKFGYFDENAFARAMNYLVESAKLCFEEIPRETVGLEQIYSFQEKSPFTNYIFNYTPVYIEDDDDL